MKRIKQLYIAAVSVVTALSMSSCNDWLDLYPSDAVPAEAAFNNGDTNTAAQMLNQIITNRTTDASKVVTASTITLDRIYIERRKELVGEGQRYFDAMRRGETITRYTSDEDRGWHDVLNEDARQFDRNSKKALPLIPADEINANPNMVQNPTY